MRILIGIVSLGLAVASRDFSESAQKAVPHSFPIKREENGEYTMKTSFGTPSEVLSLALNLNLDSMLVTDRGCIRAEDRQKCTSQDAYNPFASTTSERLSRRENLIQNYEEHI